MRRVSWKTHGRTNPRLETDWGIVNFNLFVMKKFSFSNIKSMNEVNLEKSQMTQIFGGRATGNGCTLDTVTVTPNDVKNDGDDSWDGECDQAVAPVSYLAK